MVASARAARSGAKRSTLATSADSAIARPAALCATPAAPPAAPRGAAVSAASPAPFPISPPPPSLLGVPPSAAAAAARGRGGPLPRSAGAPAAGPRRDRRRRGARLGGPGARRPCWTCEVGLTGRPFLPGHLHTHRVPSLSQPPGAPGGVAAANPGAGGPVGGAQAVEELSTPPSPVPRTSKATTTMREGPNAEREAGR